MIYYIDFDNTLYETGKLTKDVLNDLAKTISTSKNLDFENILLDLQKSFNSTKDNFESFERKIAEKYNMKYNVLLNHLQKIMFFQMQLNF